MILSWVPLILLIVMWIVIWKKIGFGKGGYRKYLADNQQRMSEIEGHLSTISSSLERIAKTLETGVEDRRRTP